MEPMGKRACSAWSCFEAPEQMIICQFTWENAEALGELGLAAVAAGRGVRLRIPGNFRRPKKAARNYSTNLSGGYRQA
ncbi:hypothetical protein CQ015_14090 [Arthrobacter sp. MYb221]|nr:hypothetical protein CQ015_14090 [Arthrobacter sp. MYb221]